MTSLREHSPSTLPPSRDAALGRAWTAVVLIPVFAVASFVLGYVLYDLLGYKPENNDAPLWVDVVVALVLLVVLLVPCVGAVVFGRRAGRPGRVPAVLGALAGLGLTTLTVVTTVADALR
jgi:MFS family permease